MPKRWQDWVVMVAGLALFASPWILRLPTQSGAFWSFIVLGVFIFALALLQKFYKPLKGTEWLSMLLGFITLSTPWLLAFGMAERWTAWFLGAVVVLFAIWEVLRTKEQKMHPA